MGSSPAWVTSWELIWQGNTITVLVPVVTDTCPGTKEISARVIRMWSALKMTWVRLKPRLWTERGLPFCKRKCQWSMNAGSQRTVNKTHSYPTSEGKPSFGTCDTVGQRSGTEVMIECRCSIRKQCCEAGMEAPSATHRLWALHHAWRSLIRRTATPQLFSFVLFDLQDFHSPENSGESSLHVFSFRVVWCLISEHFVLFLTSSFPFASRWLKFLGAYSIINALSLFHFPLLPFQSRKEGD